jgi:protein TonB
MRLLRTLGPYALSLALHLVVGGSFAAATLFVVKKVILPDPVPVELVVTKPAIPEETEEPAPQERRVTTPSIRRLEAPRPRPVKRRRVRMLTEIPEVAMPETRLDRMAAAPSPEPVLGPVPLDVPIREGPAAPPVFGVQMDSLTAGGGTLGVPAGNTLRTSPSTRGPVLGPPGRPPRRGLPTGLRPVEEHRITVWPERIDTQLFRYPEEARRAGIEGSVLLRLWIGADGRVRDAVLVRPAEAALDREALANARTLRFTPARAGGKPVPCEIRYTFTFILD